MAKFLGLIVLLALEARALTKFLDVDLANWIGDSLDVLGSKTLKDITLPGTHDSGTYYLTNALMPDAASELDEALLILAELLDRPIEDVVHEWSQSQTLNFYDQMSGGIRYFDLRAGWDKDYQDWRTFHLVIGDTVSNLLRNITQFINDHPKEIVVVEISHFDGSPTTSNVEQLETLVLDTFGDLLM